jgi:hypothetical protein
MVMRRQHYIRTLMRNMTANVLRAAMLLFVFAAIVHAHTGTVQFQKSAGNFVITLFTTPSPPRVGLVEFGVMVQNQEDGQLLLDRTVMITLSKEGGPVLTAQATSEKAQNRLLYVARLNLPDEGRWNLEITVTRGEDSANIAETMPVMPAWPSVFTYWRLLTLPFVVIVLFIINQCLKRRLLLGGVTRSGEPAR